MTHKRSILRGMYAVALTAALCACQNQPWTSFSQLAFPDFDGYKSALAGDVGFNDFGEVLVGYDSKPKVIRMKNAGTEALSIDSISFDSESFDFYDHASPTFPITIAAGATTDIFCVGFYPTINGPLTGTVMITSGDNVAYITLSGTGIWQLTLQTEGTEVNLLLPVAAVGGGVAVTHTTSTGVVRIAAETIGLQKFEGWTVIGTPKVAPAFKDTSRKSSVDTITLNAHTTIQANYYDPFIYFCSTLDAPASKYNTLSAAIAAYVGGTKEAIIVTTTAPVISENVTLPNNVSIIGGYSGGDITTIPPPRAYKEASERSSRLCRLSFASGFRLNIAATAGSSTLIEGITITNADATTVISVPNGASPVIRYCTITATGTGTALNIDSGGSPSISNNEISSSSGTTVTIASSGAILEDNVIRSGSGGRTVSITNASPTLTRNTITGSAGTDKSYAVYMTGSSPTLSFNTITGGSTSADVSSSYGIFGDKYSNPVIFRNTITGGTAGGNGDGNVDYDGSFGLYFDYQCCPLIEGNTISGGSAPGSNGVSTGVYMINNGRSTLRYNTIDSGSGAVMSRVMFMGWGAGYYLIKNQLTASGGGQRYGIYTAPSGSLFWLEANSFSNTTTGLLYKYVSDSTTTSMDDLNDMSRCSDNTEGVITCETPESIGTQEWE